MGLTALDAPTVNRYRCVTFQSTVGAAPVSVNDGGGVLWKSEFITRVKRRIEGPVRRNGGPGNLLSHDY